MSKFELYCNVDFLFQLYEFINKPIADLLNDTVNDSYYYVQLYNLIHKHSNVTIDIPDNELIEIATNPESEQYNPNFKRFLKQGTDCFISMPNEFRYMEEDEAYFKKTNPHSLFLLNKNEPECTKLEEDYGFIFISKDNIKSKLRFLFDIDIQTIIKKEKFTGWDLLKKYKHPFNSLIIADNYLLKENLDENIMSILSILLPSKLIKNDFHLTIISGDDKSGSSFNIEKRFKQIEKKLSETFDYNVNLTILKTGNIHDRNIITNYFWINSGYGFSLFKEMKVKNETNLFCLPLFNGTYFEHFLYYKG